jgi:hypothetical protein
MEQYWQMLVLCMSVWVGLRSTVELLLVYCIPYGRVLADANRSRPIVEHVEW